MSYTYYLRGDDERFSAVRSDHSVGKNYNGCLEIHIPEGGHATINVIQNNGDLRYFFYRHYGSNSSTAWVYLSKNQSGVDKKLSADKGYTETIWYLYFQLRDINIRPSEATIIASVNSGGRIVAHHLKTPPGTVLIKAGEYFLYLRDGAWQRLKIKE